MSSLKTNETGHRYWRSMDELVRTPEFEEAVRREFPNDEWDRLPPATRRSFLKVMGASMAFAGLTACRWPAEEIVPFAHRPEGRVPGVPQHFATAFEMAGAALGLVVTSFDGRPIKAEGNPQHPDSLGALSATAQALILEMYDPDRSRRLVQNQAGQAFSRSWAEFESAVPELFEGEGAGVAVLVEPTSSPSMRAMRERFQRTFPQSTIVEWAPINRLSEREGSLMAFGRGLRPVPHLAAARVVAAFDADFLNDHPASLRLTREFAAGRKPEARGMNRMWVAEPGLTGTGAMADHRAAVPHARIPAVMAAVTAALVATHQVVLPDAAEALLAACSDAILEPEWQSFADGLAADLAGHRGRGLVMAGVRQPAAVHTLAAALNLALGNSGATVDYVDDGAAATPGLDDLVTGMRDGQVQTLLILGGNPVYSAPADLQFADALATVPTSIHLALHEDETSNSCSWHLPQAHALEAWGDGRAWDGTWTMAQPLIEPLYGGRSAIEVLAVATGAEETAGYDIVRRTALEQVLGGLDFEKRWRRALHDGVVVGTAWSGVEAGFSGETVGRAAADLAELVTAPAPSTESPELVLAVDPKIYDGRFANNGWLQELPEALTKITWDNALLMSPPTARALGLSDGDVAAITTAGVTAELPVYVLPGPAPFSMTAWLGYGRTNAGQVGSGVGVDLYPLRTTGSPWAVAGLAVRPAGRSYNLATTQDHWAIDLIGFEARQQRVGHLIREASLDTYLAHPEVFREMDHHPPLVSLWKEKEYQGEQWGMAIDLNACTGCNACVMACQAENNIPVVGREQVLNQREMHWIRLDRYFRTPAGVAAEEVDGAEVAFQPMTCVQCENAPCEQVCPVAATQHTEDGINAMVYNRCVGTRYCANNCPLKVRRFNFFNYHKDVAEVSKMQFNPEVTVRSRGVMEKCTYCVQRIQKVRIDAGNEKRPIKDGEITPACAQTCPAKAIHFGNVNDPKSAVSAFREYNRSYATLAELNIKPRTLYMGRLRNPVDGGGTPTGHPPDPGHDTSQEGGGHSS